MVREIEPDGATEHEVTSATDQKDKEFELTKAEDWPKVVAKAFPFDEEVLKRMMGDLVPATLRHNSATSVISTDNPEALKKFGDNFAQWKKLFDLAWLEKEQVLEMFGGRHSTNSEGLEIVGGSMRRVVDLDIRPGVPEGSSPRGSVYIFADNIPVNQFGESLLFPLREVGFALEAIVPGYGPDALRHAELPGAPRTCATFSKAFNRHAFRS